MKNKSNKGEIILFQTDDGKTKVQVQFDGNNVWLTQRAMGELYQVSISSINEHLSHIYDEAELAPEATIRKFRIVQFEGKREVTRDIDHYALEAIIAVGYRVRGNRGTLFRQWATAQLHEYLQKGFIMDDERLKSGKNIGDDYFDELIARIRDIRVSERRFYQKITDIYATSVDYDSKSEVTQEFYKTVQNKMHWAIHGKTAAEVIADRADAKKENMGLTTWKKSPHGPIRKSDAVVAKNYLSEEELKALNLMVTAYLDFAELQAQNRKPMHMKDWIEKLDGFLHLSDRNILSHAGKVSHQMAIDHAEKQFVEYEEKRRLTEATEPVSDFDKMVKKLPAIKKKRK